jgi:hypothetical protein
MEQAASVKRGSGIALLAAAVARAVLAGLAAIDQAVATGRAESSAELGRVPARPRLERRAGSVALTRRAALPVAAASRGRDHG